MEITNEVLAEFIKLNTEVKEKNKRLDEIRRACKQRGSFTTRDYACVIDSQVRYGLPGLEEVTQCIQRQTLDTLGLIRKIPVISVRIIDRRNHKVETIPLTS